AGLAVLGIGLSRAGLLQTDPFLATAILWVAAFVVAFILYPLPAVLQAAMVVDGRLTLEAFRQTFASPGFFFLDNPATPERELAVVGWRTAGTLALAAAGYAAWRRAGGGRLRSAWLLAIPAVFVVHVLA